MKPPAMYSAPWVRLTTRIRLKDRVNPAAVMNSSAASVKPLRSDMVTRSDMSALFEEPREAVHGPSRPFRDLGGCLVCLRLRSGQERPQRVATRDPPSPL